MMPSLYKQRLQQFLPFIIGGISFIIVSVDVLTPLWYADWIFYIIPLLLISWLPFPRKYWISIALALPLLIAIGFFFSPHTPIPSPTTRAAINRISGIFALWLMTVLLVLRRRAVDRLRQAHQELENKVRERTAELTVANQQLEKEVRERMAAENKIAKYSVVLEKKVEDRTKKLLDAERLKSEFIADASHELRTPLAIIKSNIDLALGKKSKHLINPHETLEHINEEVSSISKIISELTTITQYGHSLPRGLTLQKINLQTFLKTLAMQYRVLANTHAIEIHLKIPPSLSLAGDAEKLKKLFGNLISNAVRYGTRGGFVWIEAKKINDTIQIDVRDNGMGIPARDVPHIFERFYRVDKTQSKNGEGVGLGLAICKEIAEAHGGTITGASTYHKGSVFSVTLPIKTRAK